MKLSPDGLVRRAAALAFVSGVAALAVSPSALAQTQSATTPTDKKAVELEKIEVTGSRIKRVDAEGPTPVTVIGRDQIEKSGYTSVQDILRNLSQNTGGTVDQSFTFGFTPGAAGVDLRGFGSGRTLVLLDGRRLPAYPIGIGGTDSFVDLSQIPTVMIERIEIVTDGASAIYGSDAISGVVNIITRKHMDGSVATARIAGTDHGGFANRRYEFGTGVSSSTSSLALFADYYKQNPLMISDRKYSKSDFTGGGNGSSFGSTFFGFDDQVIADPNCGNPNDAIGGRGVLVGAICRFDRTPYRQYEPEMGHASASLNYTRQFGDISSYTRMSYYESKTHTQFEPNAYSGGEGFDVVNPDAQIVNANIHNFGTVPAGASNNPTTGTGAETDGFFQRRLVEYGPRRDDTDTRGIRLLTGLNGNLGGGFTWDTGLSFNRERVDTKHPNILSSVFDNEVANNGLDLFLPIPAAVIQRTSFDGVKNSEATNLLLDATVTGPLPVQLAGGPVQLSVHVDGEHEKYFDDADPLSSLGDAFDGSSSGGGNRNYYAVGTEIAFPVTRWLELDLAGRYDDYDDKSSVNGAFSPRFAFQIRPIDTAYIRGSLGRSFRAPDLPRLFGGATKAFDSAIDSPLCVAQGGVPGQTEAIPACVEPVQSIAIRLTSNKKLKEERGTNANIGGGIEVVKNLTVSADYYYTKLKRIVTDPSTQTILDDCAEQQVFCDQIVRAPADTNGDGGVLDELGSVVFLGAQNLAQQRIKGIDGTVVYDFKVGQVGKFKAEYDVTWVDSMTLKLTKGSSSDEQIGLAEIPEWRMSGKLDWSLDNLGAYLRVDSLSSYPGQFADTDGHAPKSQYIASFTTFDMQVRYDFKTFGALALGIDNLLDRDLPLDPTATGGNRPNQFIDSGQLIYHNAIGRLGYLTYEIHF